MAKTVIIAKSGESISVPCDYSDEFWCFRINVERHTYKTVETRYNAEIEVRKYDNSNQNTENLTIYRTQRGSIECVDEVYRLLQRLLQGINNGVPIFDIRNIEHNPPLQHPLQ